MILLLFDPWICTVEPDEETPFECFGLEDTLNKDDTKEHLIKFLSLKPHTQHFVTLNDAHKYCNNYNYMLLHTSPLCSNPQIVNLGSKTIFYPPPLSSLGGWCWCSIQDLYIMLVLMAFNRTISEFIAQSDDFLSLVFCVPGPWRLLRLRPGQIWHRDRERDHEILELSTNLREVSQCLEEAPTSTLKLNI